jgi:Zn-dependent protease with chaperone function
MTDVLQVIGYFGPSALVVILASAAIGTALKLGGRRLARFAPAAQSRLLMAAALAPMFLGAVFFCGALSDWLVRGPAEFCVARVRSSHHSALLISCPVFLLVRAAIGGSVLARDVFRSRVAVGAWTRKLPLEFKSGRVVPVEEPQAFVMGILKPQVFLSAGLLARADSGLLEPLLAHEAAHVRRRDPLRRLVASIGLLLHLPGVDRVIQQLLARAQEMAADAEAVKEIGDGTRVAEALVWFARLRLRHPQPAFEFAKVDIGARVRQILDPCHQADAPSIFALLATSGGLGVLAIIAQHQLHHLSEILLRLP